MKYNGQVGQDYFVRKALQEKRDGYFLEIGSNDAIHINNTQALEKELNWKGILVEKDPVQKKSYDMYRPNSVAVIADATQLDQKKILQTHNYPSDLDQLQVDLEVTNRSTLTCLEVLDQSILDTQTFAVVTFEHDSYRGNYFDTQRLSREIFSKHGYTLVFPDVRNGMNSFEDWYLHPKLVSEDYIQSIRQTESLESKEILQRL